MSLSMTGGEARAEYARAESKSLAEESKIVDRQLLDDRRRKSFSAHADLDRRSDEESSVRTVDAKLESGEEVMRRNSFMLHAALDWKFEDEYRYRDTNEVTAAPKSALRHAALDLEFEEESRIRGVDASEIIENRRRKSFLAHADSEIAADDRSETRDIPSSVRNQSKEVERKSSNRKSDMSPLKPLKASIRQPLPALGSSYAVQLTSKVEDVLLRNKRETDDASKDIQIELKQQVRHYEDNVLSLLNVWGFYRLTMQKLRNEHLICAGSRKR
jgi:hypothetical protein